MSKAQSEAEIQQVVNTADDEFVYVKAARMCDDEIRNIIRSGYEKAGIQLGPEHLEHLVKSFYDPSYFNDVILGKPPLHYAQWKMAQAIIEHETVVICTGNMVGKSHADSTIALWYSCTRPYSQVITTAPTMNLLSKVLWKKLRQDIKSARFPLTDRYGKHRLLKTPINEFSFDENWYIIGITSTQTDKLSGFHGRYVLAIVDEASGVDTEVYSALSSLGCDKLVMTGNPLRLDGFFYEEALRAINNTPGTCFLQIASTDGPHANLEKSDWGLADRKWLRQMAARYGRNTIWWQSHVEGRFPESNDQALIEAKWLTPEFLADKHTQGGRRKISVDIAEGGGGDHSVILVTDSNGVLDWFASNTIKMGELAQKVAYYCAKYHIDGRNVVYDKSGSGNDFANRLRQVQVFGPRPYKGGWKIKSVSAGGTWRCNSGWLMRNRLDPDQMSFKESKTGSPQIKYYIPPGLLEKLRPELLALCYENGANNKIKLTSKETISKRLGHSPDFADALMMAFAY